MLSSALLVVCAAALAPLSLLVIYEWLLALVSLVPAREPARAPGAPRTRFVVLIPAYNEEAGLAITLNSLRQVDYPPSHVQVVVVADRCTDGTVARARAGGVDCLERTEGAAGKGAALAWAIDALRRRGTGFDALVVIDADTVAEPALLDAFDASLQRGHDVQQAYNYLSNPWDTPFTRIISVTSVLRNGLFYAGKERLGLPAMLTGSGMCLSRRILAQHGWTAFSVGEDWEFSASLLLAGERIHFNRRACVRAAESRNFSQASSQRLRWASGRHAVASTNAVALLRAGVRRRQPGLCDAAVTIAAPTYAVQATLAIVCLAAGWAMAADPSWRAIALWAAAVTGLLAAYFAVGVALTDAPLRALGGIALIPIFLPWRMAIEVLGLLGCGRTRWVRTAR